MVAGADGDALPVEDLRDVVRVHALELEADDAGAPVGRRPEDADAGDLREPVHRLHDELVLVLLDRLEPDRGDVVDRDPEAVRLGDRGRARLELVRQLVPARPVERDRADHLAAEVERLHRLEQLAPAPERADAARAAQLVRREGEEVAAERLHVDRPVRRGLRRVDDHDRALLVRPRRRASRPG